MWTTLLAAGLGLCTAANHRQNLGTDRILRVHADRRTDITSAVQHLDVWGRAEDGGLEVRVPADGAHMEVLAATGVRITDVTEAHMSHFDFMADPASNQTCHGPAEACLNDFYTQYQTRANINAYVDTIRNAHPNLVTKEEFGLSEQGNMQEGVKITAATSSDAKAIFYFCGEHAREWLPPMFCTYVIDQLANLYESDQEVKRILDTYEVYVLPVMNPDGYDYSHTTNNMWRKNRQDNQGSTCIGTDLNRNYNKEFGGPGSSNSPCSDTYRGPTAFSAPETTNLQSFADRMQGRIVVQTDVHAYGRMWMHPWGYTYDQPVDEPAMKKSGDATVAAIRGVHGQVFASGSIANVIYLASGSSCDHFYANHGTVYAYAPEVRGNSFQPAASNIVPSNEELWAGFLAQVANI